MRVHRNIFRGMRGVKGLVLSVVVMLSACALLFGGVAYAVAPSVEIINSDGTLFVDAEANIIFVFDQQIFVDESQTVFVADDAALSAVFSVSRQAGGTEVEGVWEVTTGEGVSIVTFTPDSAFSETDQAIVAEVNDQYYNADGEQGSAVAKVFAVKIAAETPETAPTTTPGAVEETASTETETTTESTDTTTTDTEATDGEGTQSDEGGKSEDEESGKSVDIVPDDVIDPDVVSESSTWPTVVISPDSAQSITNTAQTFAVTFAEQIYSDANGSVLFTDETVVDIVTMHRGSASGSVMEFDAVVEDSVVTITPRSIIDLTGESVHLAISDAYYNAAGVQGGAVAVDFAVVDETPPSIPTIRYPVAVEDDIVVTFGGVVYESDGNTEITTSNIISLIDLREIVSDAPVGYTVTQNGNVFTLDPDVLERGVEYSVVVSDEYYDTAGNKGSGYEVFFTIGSGSKGKSGSNEGEGNQAVEKVEKDVVVSFSPDHGSVVDDVSTNIIVSFDQPVYKNSEGDVFTDSDLAQFVSLLTRDESGYATPFSATMSDDNMTITIDPINDLPVEHIYVAISADYYTAGGMRGTHHEIIFRVDSTNFFFDLFEDLFVNFFLRNRNSGAGVSPITKTYTLGMFGTDVKLVQVLLDKADCVVSTASESDPSVVIGYLDVFTREALECYQGRRNLVVTGNLTPETFSLLVDEYYENELAIPSFGAFPIVSGDDFRRILIDQTYYLLRQVQASLELNST